MITLCCGRPASRQAALIGMLAPVLLFFARSVAAEIDFRTREYEFDIPRTSRVMALHELSRQTGGLMLGYMSSSPQEEKTLVGPIKGRFTVEAALGGLLRSSSLSYRWIDADMISVEPSQTGKSDATLGAGDRRRTGPRSNDLDAVADLSGPEEVLVLGWPIRDLALTVSPVVVVDRNDLDGIGVPSLPEALRHLSQNVFTRPEGFRTSGAQYAEMRGLGPDAALILINGRRTLPSANSIASSAFDLNAVPITAVERIELVLDSAAAAYGMDAIGGIINIVLRDKVARPELDGRYGASEGGARQERLTFSGGLNEDKRHGVLVLDYSDSSRLLGEERAFWRDQNYERFGGRDHRSLISHPGNISAIGGNLPGLSAPVAGVPLTDPTPGVSVQDFVGTAGQPTRESLLRYSSVVPEARRLTLLASAAAELAQRLTMSTDVLYVNRKSAYHFLPPVLFSSPVPAGNAFNPFGTPVLANRLLSEYPAQYQAFESDFLRAVAALRGGRGAWNWEVSALYSKEEASTWIANLLDPVAVSTALASSDAATALNPFTPGPIGSPELLDSLFAVRDEDDFASEGKQLAGFIQGPAFRLPAGSVTTVLGGEWRNESITADDEGPAALDRNRDVVAGFIQLRVPVLSESMQLPWAHELTFSAGSRWDHYSGRLPDVARSHLGLVWKPLRSLSVRASGSGSFRPPSLYELYLPQISTVARVNDPSRNNELANVTLTIGGNEKLRPSTGRSYTAGVLFSPDTALNWKISADYWRIDVRNRVVALPPQLMLANEEQFRARIARDEETGVLRSIDVSRADVGAAKLAGIDLGVKADVLTNAGRFTPELSVTWFDSFESQDIPNGPTVERVDVASPFGTILEWRAIFSLRWNRGPYGASMIARHTPSYDDVLAGARTGRRVESQTLFDLHGSLDLGRLKPRSSLWNGVKLWVGATNLLNEAPSFAEVGDATGFDMSQGDLKQRSLYLRIDKTF